MSLTKTFLVACALAASMSQAIELDHELDLDECQECEVLAQVEFKSTPGLTPHDIKYFAQPYWDEKTRAEKMKVLWDMLVPTVDGVAHVEGPQDRQFRHFPEGLEANQNNTFCVLSDEMRRNRNKFVHAQGVHAKVKWNPVSKAEGNKYTGMFATGSDSVIMRLSETQNITKYTPGLLPSVAFKFLRDGEKSSDIVAMPSFEPTRSWNFFEPAMNTRVAPITEESNKCLFDTLIASL